MYDDVNTNIKSVPMEIELFFIEYPAFSARERGDCLV
jgi:hypothetical protein